MSTVQITKGKFTRLSTCADARGIIAAAAMATRQTGAAARTYNILMAENRKVAAALIAVP